MRRSFLILANSILLATAFASIGHFLFRWNQLRPEILINPPLECGEFMISGQAHYLAIICQGVIEAHGSLPENPIEAARTISSHAAELGFTWPGDYKTNSAGELCDCSGEPFQISVSADRVAVTSSSLDTFYFAGLYPQRNATHE